VFGIDGFYIFVFVVMGLIGALTGSRKGRPVAGFIFSVLLGPVGWLIALVFGPAKSHKCPVCGGTINPKFSKCRHCGSELSLSV